MPEPEAKTGDVDDSHRQPPQFGLTRSGHWLKRGSITYERSETMIRTRYMLATFSRPFTLPGLDRPYSAGSYRVDIDEEQLEVSFAASRRVATTMMLVSGGMTQAWPVDPKDLDAALAADSVTRH
jgi:hypothetical protein